jgi:hypothetical protein
MHNVWHYLYAICVWLEQTSVGDSVKNSSWQFPIIETVHIFGIVLVVGSTSILDLRLMGLALREKPVSRLARRFLPWTWGGFLLMAITGILLLASEATKMFDNLGFRIKMLLIVMAGVNALVFHLLAYQSVGKWENDRVAPLSARAAGLCSILLWFGIVAAGRWIAYI